MSSIRLSGLTKAFGGRRPAVDGLQLTIEDGEFLSLLGPSGCGKTTTLRCIAGLVRPDKGEIHFDDSLIVSPERNTFVPPEKRHMGMVFQSYALWPHMTVFGNVSYPLKRAKRRQVDVSSAVGAILDLVGLADCGGRLPSQLSGGQQQRVALARALVNEPHVVLFDEPFSNLDTLLRSQMREEVRRLHDRLGTTSIYVTHDQVEAMALSDRIVIMQGGLVQQMGTPREIYTAPANRFVADFLGFENIVTAEVKTADSRGSVIQLGEGGPALRAAISPRPVAGDHVEIAVRASAFRLVPQVTAVESGFTGLIEAHTYLGEDNEYRVRVGNVLLVARILDAEARAIGGGKPPGVGDSVSLQVNPEELIQINAR